MKDEKPIEVLKEEGNEFREGEEMKEVGEKEDLGRDDEFGAEIEVREGEESGEREEEEEEEEIYRMESDRGTNAKRIKNLPIDHLSALPNELLIHILSFLGVKRAAITSVLSKRWRFIWVELPNLEFFDSYVHCNRTPQFVAWVDRVLAVRSRKDLDNFDLNMWYGNRFASNIDAWVEFAVESKVKEFTLQMTSGKRFYTLSERLYTSPSLTKLSLQGCIMAPERKIEWKLLASLYILDMKLPQHLLDQMLLGCPLLSMFDLCQCWGFKCMKINSPSLHELRVHHSNERKIGPLLEISAPYIRRLCFSLRSPGIVLRLTDIQSVDTAAINLNGLDTADYSFASANVQRNAKELVEKTKHVKKLEVGHHCFEILSLMVAEGWQPPQSRRASLTVSVFPDDKDIIPGMIGLLESSPDLETLVVHRNNYDEKVVWKPPARDDLNCDLLHLKSVTIEIAAEPVLGGEPMLTLARILLKRATALEEMLLLIDVEDRDVLVNMGVALLTYPRSSGKALVRFYY